MGSGKSQPKKISLPLWVLLMAMFVLVAALTSWAFGAIVQNIASKRLADEYTESVTNTTKLLVDTTITSQMLHDRQAMQKFIEHWSIHDKDLTMVQMVDPSGEMLFDWRRDQSIVDNPIYLTISVDNDEVSLGEVFAQWRPESMINEVKRRVSLAQRFSAGITFMLAMVFFVWTHWLVVRPVVAIDKRLRAVVSGDKNVSEKRHWASHELSRLDNTTDMLAEEIRRREEAEKSAIEASKEAMAANVAKSRFLANMSHELRTPLNSIMGYSELIREDAESGDTGQIIKDAGRVHSAAEHLLQLINDVLDLSKIEAGKFELLCEDVNIDNLLAECLMILQPLAENKGNKITYSSPSVIGTIVTDGVRLKQIMCNLLSNACKFTDHGSVTITADRFERKDSEWISVSVIDTGIGIDTDKLEMMFEEFSQADATTTRQFGGTGLGLAISRKLCELMGGELHVQSELGKGATFTVSIPCDIRKHAMTDHARHPDIHSAALNKKPI